MWSNCGESNLVYPKGGAGSPSQGFIFNWGSQQSEHPLGWKLWMALGHGRLTPSVPTPTTALTDCWMSSTKTFPLTKGLAHFSRDRISLTSFQRAYNIRRRLISPHALLLYFWVINQLLESKTIFSHSFCRLSSWSWERCKWLVWWKGPVNWTVMCRSFHHISAGTSWTLTSRQWFWEKREIVWQISFHFGCSHILAFWWLPGGYSWEPVGTVHFDAENNEMFLAFHSRP